MSIYPKIQAALPQFKVPETWLSISTIDLHTGGEPLRVIVGGFPKIEGDSVLTKRRYCFNHLDHLRKALMWEPRGHADMYGCLLTPPNDPSCDFGVIFMHNEGYSTMCGHAIIALTKLAFEMEWKSVINNHLVLNIDAPCGRITSFARLESGEVVDISFEGVPSFRIGNGFELKIEPWGTIEYELAYGGAFYAYVNSNQFNLRLVPENYQEIIALGKSIKKKVIRSNPNIHHPLEEDLSFLYGTIFIEESTSPGIHSRNVCVFADGEVDRCPTGSGLSGRLPIHYARGEINVGKKIEVESILGSTFGGCINRVVQFGPHKAVIPQISGNAFITGQHQFVIDPKDPFKEGFFLN